MPHTRWSAIRQGAAEPVDLTHLQTFCRGYLLALDDLLLDIDGATDMPSLVTKIQESRMSTLRTLSYAQRGIAPPLDPAADETAP